VMMNIHDHRLTSALRATGKSYAPSALVFTSSSRRALGIQSMTKNKPLDSELKLYAERLYNRRTEAVMLQWADVSIDSWRPHKNECHGNVSEVCVHDNRYSPARGWLYFDFNDTLPSVKFVAHSALRDMKGTLYNITPAQVTQQYPFILAEESEEEYASLVESGVTELWHLK